MSTEFRALAALFAGAIAIGAAPICVRLSVLGPEAVAFWRLLLGGLILLPLYFRGRAAALPVGGRVWGLLLIAGFSFAGDLAIWHYSIHYTSVANATLLANVAPVFVALITVLLFRQRLAGGFFAGLACALAGAAVLVGASFDLGAKHVRGDVLGIVTAAFYAVYQLSVAAVRRSVDTWTVMLVSTWISALLLWPVAAAAGPLMPPHAGEWALLLFLAGFSHVGGQGLIAWALAHLSTAFSSAGLLLQPVAAALFAWWLLGEAVGGAQLFGGGVVLAGIYLCRRATAGSAGRNRSNAAR